MAWRTWQSLFLPSLHHNRCLTELSCFSVFYPLLILFLDLSNIKILTIYLVSTIIFFNHSIKNILNCTNKRHEKQYKLKWTIKFTDLTFNAGTFFAINSWHIHIHVPYYTIITIGTIFFLQIACLKGLECCDNF